MPVDRRDFMGAAGFGIAGLGAAGLGLGGMPSAAAAEAMSSGATVNAMSAGARANGRDDDHPALQAMADKLGEGQTVSFPAGRYHLSKPLVISAPQVALLGFGAIFDHTIYVHGVGLKVMGLTVKGAPGPGFRFFRGQGGHFEALSATDNNGPGFLLGGADHHQVAWSSFVGCTALRNKGDGWLLDANNYEKTWINANTFVGCWSRSNGGCGWKSVGRANYNTWFATQVEDNCHNTQEPPILLGGQNNFFFGGHVVDTRRNGVSMRLPRNGGMIFGGRYIGAVEGANFIQAVQVPTSTGDVMDDGMK